MKIRWNTLEYMDEEGQWKKLNIGEGTLSNSEQPKITDEFNHLLDKLDGTTKELSIVLDCSNVWSVKQACIDIVILALTIHDKIDKE